MAGGESRTFWRLDLRRLWYNYEAMKSCRVRNSAAGVLRQCRWVQKPGRFEESGVSSAIMRGKTQLVTLAQKANSTTQGSTRQRFGTGCAGEEAMALILQ